MVKTELGVVIRGLPAFSESEDIKEDLINQGFDVISVHKLTSQRTLRKILSLFLIEKKNRDEDKQGQRMPRLVCQNRETKGRGLRQNNATSANGTGAVRRIAR